MSSSAGGASTSSAAPVHQQQARTRQRVHKAPPSLAVPDINADAAERKRVLNVLAQRRYRERKRTNRKSTSAPRDSAAGDATSLPSAEGSCGDGLPEPTVTDPTPRPQQPSLAAAKSPLQPGVVPILDPSVDFDAALSAGLFDLSHDTSFSQSEALAGFLLDNADMLTLHQGDHSTSVTALSPPTHAGGTIDPSALFGGASPSLSSSSSSSASLPMDSYLLPVSELTLLRAFMRIADRLGCTRTVWDLAAVSHFCSPDMATSASSPTSLSFESLDLPFDPSAAGDLAAAAASCASSGSSHCSSLPPAWQPTASQLLVRHHPLLDFLPWASARDRIISVFALPEWRRPAGAQGPLGLVNLVYDLEDGAEGMRIWGGDPYDPAAWEVGQIVFERWWFIFDRGIIEQSNRWRKMRGAAELRLHSGGGHVEDASA